MVPRNEVRSNSFHCSRREIRERLVTPHLWESGYSKKKHEGTLKLIKTRKQRLGSCGPNMTRVQHFRPALALMKVDVSTRFQINTAAVKGADHLACIFSNKSHIRVPYKSRIGVCIPIFYEGTMCPRREHPFIVTGRSFRSHLRCWNVTSLVSEQFSVFFF